MKKYLSLLLLISILGGLFGCSSGDEKNDKDSSSDTTQGTVANINSDVEPINEELASLDYKGEVFNILARKEKHHVGENEIWVEEYTNDPINDAIYERNLYVQELLGIEIREVRQESHGDIQDSIDLMVGSGDQTYDLAAASVYYGTPMITRGNVYNLYENNIDTYLDLTKPWWPQYWIDEAEIDDRLYCVTGSPALSFTRLMYVTYYNKAIAAEHKLENLYDVVEDGRWTIDYLTKTVSGMYNDNNGNSIRDEEDTYGILIDNYCHVDIFWSSFDMRMLVKDTEGWFEINTRDKDKISRTYDIVYSLIYENTGSYNMGGFKDDGAVFEYLFSDGKALFVPAELLYAETTEYRNMQDDYGVLPTPKYDEKQDKYYTYVHDQYSIFMIPITVRDQVMSGAVLEAMAYESYRSLHPVYYDKVLKGRYLSDPQSRRILDMIVTNVTMDPAWIYGGILGVPAAEVMRNPIELEKQNFASSYAKVERSLPQKMKIVKMALEGISH
ncbi:MAG: hypothetical protein IKT70_07845 [Clostridia bacterium]|nr:hypothetical protein [Clostridia bacterium]